MVANRMAAFLEQLREFAVLTPAQLKEVEGASLAKADDPVPLAKTLLNKGWLTAFQANLLLKGKGSELILGAYRLQEPVGQGGMGTVFRAQHTTMDRLVALKVIKKDKLANPVAVQRFYKEIRAAAQLTHPNVVTAFDAGQAAGTHFFAMEYVEGIDLQKCIKEKGPLPIADACEYIRQAALGLQHAYEKGLVHRDIKPANLLLSRDGGRSRGTVKVLDMGLARVQGAAGDDGSITRVGTVVGTPEFMAPEQALRSHAVDIRADLYSLGCTLFFLLTGRPPFVGDSVADLLVKHHAEQPPPLEQFRSEVPPGIQDIMTRLLAKQPEDRYQAPAELAAALAPFARVGGAPPGPEAITPVPNPSALTASPWATVTPDSDPPSRPSLRKPARRVPTTTLAVAAAGLFLLLGGAILAAVVFSGDSKAKPAAQAPPAVATPREKAETRTEAPPRTEPVKLRTEATKPATMRDTTPPAAKADYVGTWKWSYGVADRMHEIHMTIKLDGDKLSATATRDGRETPIDELKLQDGELSFRMTYMRTDGMKHFTHYLGRLSGESIKGKADSSRPFEWKAERLKP